MLNLTFNELHLLSTNPQQFQQMHLESWGLPPTSEIKQRQDTGSQFHLLMRQKLMGLPVEPILETYPQMRRWLTFLQKAAPEIFTEELSIGKEWDYSRTLMCEGHLLKVVYNLLLTDSSHAQIIEWTTSALPPITLLEKDWKTRLYLYVLAETTDYPPSSISMTYWFVQSEIEPIALRLDYDEALHALSKIQLTALLNQLNSWMKKYQELGERFPSNKGFYTGNTNNFHYFESKTVATSFEDVEEISI